MEFFQIPHLARFQQLVLCGATILLVRFYKKFGMDSILDVTPGDNYFDPLNWKGILIAWLLALISTSISLVWGNWLARVKR